MPNGVKTYKFTFKASELNADSIMTADFIGNLNSLNHKAMNEAAGINGLYGDGHVLFLNDEDALDERYWEPVPNNDRTNFRSILALFAR